MKFDFRVVAELIMLMLTASIAYCVTNTSPVAAGNADSPQGFMQRDVGIDQTVINPSIDYVKVKWLSPVQEKPFPTTYFTGRKVITNKWILETDVVMQPTDLALVFAIGEKVPCLPPIETRNATLSTLEILEHRAGKKSTRCRVRQNDACHYLSDLTSTKYLAKIKYDLASVANLSKLINCPAA